MKYQSFYLATSALCLLAISTLAQEVIPQRTQNQVRLSFGSCNKFTEREESEIFSKITEQNPDAFVWLGDAAYIDIREFIHLWKPDTDPVSIARKFNNVKEDKYYKQLKSSETKILGVWDDHDYNNNDGGKDFKGKQMIQQLYLDFLDEPKSSPRRSSTTGIYTSYYLGEDKRVKLILLDVRFERESKDLGEGRDMLGQYQWNWLEKELSDPDVLLYIIGSGTQVIPDDRLFQEQWSGASRRKLLSIVKSTKAGVLIISGDIHQAEIMTMPCSEQYLGYQLKEITSSGLSFTNVELDHLFPFFEQIVPLVVPPTFSNLETDRYLHRNYGMIVIDWNEVNLLESSVQLFIYGNRTLSPVLAEVLSLKDLKPDATLIQNEINCPVYEKTGGQRVAANYIVLLKSLNIPAIVLTVLGALLLKNAFKFLKAILGLCFGSAGQKLKKE